MDFDELFDPHMHHCRHHYGQLQQQNHSVDPVATSAALQQWQQLQIEELPSDDGANDTLYLQPEADQQQALLSEATSLLLSKPPAASVYSIVEM